MSAKKLLKKGIKLLKSSLVTSYYCHYFYKSKIKNNMVFFESRNGLDVAGNIFYLLKELQNGEYGNFKAYLSVCPQINKKAVSMLKTYNVKNVRLVKQGSLKYLRLISKAKYIFTDTSLPRAYVKKEGQIFTNTWHGTPLKKMGKHNLNERHSMGNIQRNLLFSDYLIYPNDYMKDKMLSSYNIDTVFKGEILLEGYPRNSVFFNKADESIKKNLSLENKEVYVYMPTWKAENMGKGLKSSLDEMYKRLKKIESLLSENQVIMLKLHPLVRGHADLRGFDKIVSFPENYEAYHVLNACDGLITDYSSVFFDFACSQKKIVLYTPDEQNYDNSRGFYIPLSQLPFTKCSTEEELIKALNAPINYDIKEFKDKFCTYDNIDASKNILNHILLNKKVCKSEKIEDSGKKKVLFYCGALLQNGITASFKNLLSLIDLDEREYFFAFKHVAFNSHPERLSIIPDKLKMYSLSGTITTTIMESLSFLLYYKFNKTYKFVLKYVNRAYDREFQKKFSHLKMDHIIHFSGYDEYIIKLFERFCAKKSIFVHSDMQQELSSKTNQHRPTLRYAYRKYDNVAVVTNAMAEPTFKISGKKDNIVVVENTFNYKLVKEKGNGAIEYQSETRNSIHHPKGIEGILNEKGKKFITVGRYSHEKQHNMLIDAFCEYNEKNPDSYLIIIGGAGNLYNKTVAYANSKSCSKNIAFIYSIQNPMPIIKKCDLFILSSKYEALGLVLFEADALSVPSICTEMKGPDEIIKKYGGTMIPNSKEGILEGIEAFEKGEVKPMNIDFEKYNAQALSEFEKLF